MPTAPEKTSTEKVDPPDAQTVAAARRAVARTAIRTGGSAEDVRKVLAMLGLVDTAAEERKPGMCPGCGKELPIEAHSPKAGLGGYCSRTCRDKHRNPAPPRTLKRCQGCDSPMASTASKGVRRHCANGLCDPCYQQARRGAAPVRTCPECDGTFKAMNEAEPRCPSCVNGRMRPARAARARIEQLRQTMTWTEIVAVTGISTKPLREIATGKTKRIYAATERAILAVAPLGEAGAA